MTISKRVQQINSSGIRKAFTAAADLKNPINLSIGVPAFPAPEELQRGAIAAIEDHRDGYTLTLGLAELRNKLRQKHGLDKNTALKDFDVIVSSGVSATFLLAYSTLLDPGDEVVVPDPFFAIYRDLGRLLNAEVRCYDTYPDFVPTAERIERMITDKTKLIVLNFPGNPTGVVPSVAELDQIVELAAKHSLWILSDEIYSAFSHDSPHQTLLGKYPRLIVVDGFSKSHGIPGWRLGYAIAPQELILAFQKVQQYTFVCAPVIAQYGALAAIDWKLGEIAEDYRKKRDFMTSALKGLYNFAPSRGAFYLFPEAPGGSGSRFFERCLKEELVIVAGEAFSLRDTHFRLSYSAPWEALERGAEVLRRLA